MSKTNNLRRNARIVTLAALLVVVGGIAAAPTASAHTVIPPGCTGQYVTDVQWNPSFEDLGADTGRYIDCVL